MAKAVIQNGPQYIQLTLSLEEAAVLRQLFSIVGGSPKPETPRGMVDSIDRAIASCGVARADFGCRGSIYFND